MDNTGSDVENTKREVVLVDSEDNRLGTMEILTAHKGIGTRHRAISVLLHDGKGVVLLQRRGKEKPLWPLVWSNTVCTHPFDGEGYVECAVRRLKEEMGIMVGKADLVELYKFEYGARYDEWLSENELDTVIVGRYKGGVKVNRSEVEDYKWMAWEDVKEEVVENAKEYTPWFRMMVEEGRVGEVVSGIEYKV